MTTNVPALDGVIENLMRHDQASVIALLEIAEERLRQIQGEGWSPEHDDAHDSGDMARAASCYALHSSGAGARELRCSESVTGVVPGSWPWGGRWWKPRSPHRDQIRASALLVAELARHLRSAPKTA